MKEVNRIKLESLKKENMKKKGYIGEFPHNFFSVVFLFESSPSHEQVVEAIERYFNSHANHLRDTIGFPRFIDYKEVSPKDLGLDYHIESQSYIKVDFMAEIDYCHNHYSVLDNHNLREMDFDKWIEDYISKNGSDAELDRFATETHFLDTKKKVRKISVDKKQEGWKELKEVFED